MISKEEIQELREARAGCLENFYKAIGRKSLMKLAEQNLYHSTIVLKSSLSEYTIRDISSAKDGMLLLHVMPEYCISRLRTAAKENNIDALKLLLENGALVDEETELLKKKRQQEPEVNFKFLRCYEEDFISEFVDMLFAKENSEFYTNIDFCLEASQLLLASSKKFNQDQDIDFFNLARLKVRNLLKKNSESTSESTFDDLYKAVEARTKGLLTCYHFKTKNIEEKDVSSAIGDLNKNIEEKLKTIIAAERLKKLIGEEYTKDQFSETLQKEDEITVLSELIKGFDYSDKNSPEVIIKNSESKKLEQETKQPQP